ncbi:hypothetical protein JHK86_010607 [Glycine max]|nr:hypothetical protein JHK86_010607 [Glycine max]
MFFKRGECRAKGGALGFKVAILGATGGIGQSLSLLMMMNPLVSVLHLYDVVNTPSVTTDVSHMDTGVVVRGFSGQQQLESALTGMDLVIILAGVLRKPRMTRDYLFKINVRIVRILSRGIAKCCPNAIVNLISNLVNSTVAIAAEVSKKVGTYDPKRLLGVTTLDVVRANTFVNRQGSNLWMGICKLGSSSANALIGDDEMVRVWGNAWVPGNWRLIDVAEVMGGLKLNCNATISLDERKVTASCVLRNHFGAVIFAFAANIGFGCVTCRVMGNIYWDWDKNFLSILSIPAEGRLEWAHVMREVNHGMSLVENLRVYDHVFPFN